MEKRVDDFSEKNIDDVAKFANEAVEYGEGAADALNGQGGAADAGAGNGDADSDVDIENIDGGYGTGAEDAETERAGGARSGRIVDIDDDDDDVKIAPVRTARTFEAEKVVEDEVDSLFEGIDDPDDNATGTGSGSDDGDEDADDVAVEAVSVAGGAVAGKSMANVRSTEKKSSTRRPGGSKSSKGGEGKNSAKSDKKSAKNQKKKAANAAGKDKNSKKGGNGDKRAAAQPESGEQVGRHAVTTSRGVVYVESYSDDDYEFKNSAKSRVAKIIAALFIVAMLAVAGIMFVNYCRNMVAGDTVYEGITLNGKSVSGLTRDELLEYMKKTYTSPVASSTIEVKAGTNSLVYPLNAIIKLPDTEALADEIYSYARSGNLISRAFKVIGLKADHKNFTLGYEVNEATINSITEKMSEVNSAKVDPSYVIEEDQVVFTYGVNGLELSSDVIRETLMSYTDSLLKSLTEGTAQNSVSGTVNLVPRTVEFKKLLKINVVNDLPEKAVESKIERRSATEVWVSPGTDGASYDEALLDKIIDDVNSGVPSDTGTEILPLERESSILTKEFYEGVLFRDVLGSGENVNIAEEDETKAAKFADREKNIAIAVGMLDGLVIMPDETLDFLMAIKVADTKSGYVEAYENYAGWDNLILGGGISQVSTALYNAAYLAGIGVVTQTNYTYAPQFGTLGFDAYTDSVTRKNLVIKNNTTMPVKLAATYVDGTVSVKISGTVFTDDDFRDEEGNLIDDSMIPEWIKIENSRPEKRLYAQVALTDKYTSYEFSDGTMFEGETRVTQTGVNGCTLNLYLIVTENGTDDSQFIGIRSYAARDEYIAKGTMPAPTDLPTEIPTDIPTEIPTNNTDDPVVTDVPATDIPDDPTPTDIPDDPTPTDIPDNTDIPEEPAPIPEG